MQRHMHGLQMLGVVLLAGLGSSSPSVWAQNVPGSPSSETTAVDSPAALLLQGDTVVVFRSSVAGVVPSRRVEIATTRLEALRPPGIYEPIRSDTIPGGRIVLVGDAMAFFVMDTDVDPKSGETTHDVAARAVERLRAAMVQRAKLLSPAQRLWGLIASIIATVVLVVLLGLVRWGQRVLAAWMISKTHGPGHIKVGNVDVMERLSGAAVWTLRIAVNLVGLAFVFLWAVFVLNRFAETQQWGLQARWFLRDTLRSFQNGILRALPGLVAATLVIIIGRFLTRLASEIFVGIERGRLRVPGVHPETANATRRLVNTFLWVFTIVLAYPFLPGSDSEAFKGVSVFLGILITLGSTGVVGHMMSGLVLVYSRALKPGDMVRVADIEGVVLEVGALSTKLANIKNEEFTIPNTVMVSTTIKNYSRLAREGGNSLTTTLTIGYDAPWRVVHEMLLAAAARTEGIRKEPAPFVLQMSLSDFYVEYQLTVRIERPDRRVWVLNQLHQNIQDAFNERGVQIMSPHFEGQPDHPIMVPKSKWTEAPLDPKGPGAA